MLDDDRREESAVPPTRDFSLAEQLVKLMKDLSELDGAAIVKFVGARKFDEVAASLAALNDVPTELMARVLEGPRADLILIPCKSVGLELARGREPSCATGRCPQPISEQSLWQADATTAGCPGKLRSAPCASGSCITGSRKRGRAAA